MSVRMGLLALLEEGPAHGYHLKGAFEARTGGVWTVNVGQVYTTLDRLHGEGLVDPVDDDDPAEANSGGRDRRRWRLTTAGKAALDDWFDEGPADTSPPRDELLVKVLLAFGRSPVEALAVIDRQRAELYRQAQAHRRARSRAAAREADQPTGATVPTGTTNPAGPLGPAGASSDHAPNGGHGRTRATDSTNGPDLRADQVARVAADLMAEAISARHEADLRWLDHCEAVILSNQHEGRNP
jgi:DNA-binding PadR family transcriptional regulator